MKEQKQSRPEKNQRDPLEIAAAEWHMAQERFQNAATDQLIDMAIFDMEAAKRRYVFLLREQKNI